MISGRDECSEEKSMVIIFIHGLGALSVEVEETEGRESLLVPRFSLN